MPEAAAPEVAGAYDVVVGLEVHCELRTATKLFCGCPNAFGDEPNTNVCPVCLGLPGSLPVLNRRAVELAMRVGEALSCQVRPSIFHRKNYFYPDMPKDYQISQYDEPINVDGRLELPDGSVVGIERAHLEEDTGKSTHVGGSGRIHGADHALVDYNRAGVPLVEIVSRPDLRSAAQAVDYVRELRAILVATGASDGKMEEGSLRVDANVSVRPAGEGALGTRCEIKNLNSLRSLSRAIDYEAARQWDLVRSGERVVQETRHWNEDAGRTTSGRSKEEAYDYRYFPEPDLVPLEPDEAWRRQVRASLPVLPAARRRRVARATGVDAGLAATVVELDLDSLVMAAVAARADGRRAVNRAVNEVAADLGAARRLDPAAFTKLLRLEDEGRLTATQAKQVLAELLAGGGDPEAIARARGFEALGADALAAAVDEAIAAHPAEWERFRGGDAKVTGFFVGQVMRATAGKADGRAVTSLLRERAAGP
ncbi:MAG TPA: Asp-tRNA(Asn)/Glu-tRNA(Gln) amidotransferase subunit GatB [Acidimicrobiales bacterium]|nr:Asp-tRNA(Asn)/Glu-tRNA(Gln) amidotransferase subunit GatB [Acidimicrobiales bacterium]